MKTLSTCVLAIVLALAALTSGKGQLERLPREIYRLDWPATENWQVGNRQENDRMVRVDMVRGQDATGNRTESVVMMSYKGVQKMDVENVMNAIHQEYLKRCYNARLTVIEKDVASEYPWVIFTVECEVFDNGEPGESYVWQIVQGKFALYTHYRAFHTGSLSQEYVGKTASFFKTGRLTYTE